MGIIMILTLGLIFSLYYHIDYVEITSNNVKKFQNKIYKIERKFIESIPIYTDYATPSKEKELRKYLFRDHIAAAKKYGTTPVHSLDSINSFLESNKLVKLDQKDKLYYFYNVKKEYRYLTPAAARGLDTLTERFQKNLSSRADLPHVKLAISSALRLVSYQKKLMKRNSNATIVSTHSYGVSFDIFFEDYYVKLPEPENSNKLSEELIRTIRERSGFMLGDSLRRQFRSILMETLLQLQNEGVLYAILERKQHCYHVTILN